MRGVNDSTLPGWHVQINSGGTATGTLQVSNGTNGALNGLLNLGAAGAVDRALGSKATGSGNLANISHAVQFHNASGSRLMLKRISYTGELWRTNSTTGGLAENLYVLAARSATPITDLQSGPSSATPSAGSSFGGFTTESNWISPVTLPEQTALDGNAAANRLRVAYVPSVHFSGHYLIEPGQYFMLIWTDTNISGTDGHHGLDDVAVEFVSEAGPGGRDATFSSTITGSPYQTSLQSGGRILLGGIFTAVNGTARNNFCRLHPDGSLDTSFTPSGISGAVWAFRHTTEGVLYVGGNLLAPRKGVARYSADGVWDSTFNPNTALNSVSGGAAMGFTSDGKIYLGGNLQGSHNIVRVDQSGTQDSTFTAWIMASVAGMVPATGGQIIVGGPFSSPGGYLTRCNADGTRDTSYAPNANERVVVVHPTPDGKLLAGGYFTSIGGSSRTRIARLNASGSADAAFNPAIGPDGLVSCIVQQVNGRILIGGRFDQIGSEPASGLARLLPSGALDTTFQSFTDSGDIDSITLQGDGRILVTGSFNTVSGQPATRIARLTNDPAISILEPVSPQVVRWQRGGSAPEAESVVFHLSTNGGTTWQLLGSGSRISGGWLLQGLTLPTTGRLRARAFIPQNASNSVVEEITDYENTPLELWRYAQFATFLPIGTAADDADPDKDGLENLVEFAFGRNPQQPDAALLPGWQLEDDDFVLRFTPPPGVGGITYHAEYSSTLAPGSWQPATQLGSVPQIIFAVPATGPRTYMRLRVTTP